MRDKDSIVKLIVFDCDGTLVDSQATIVTCAQAAFEAAGLAVPSAEAIRRIVGLSLVEAMHELNPAAGPATAARVAQHYREAFIAYRAGPDFHEPLFPGARELLDELLARDYLLGVATGKAMRGLLAVLAGLSLGCVHHCTPSKRLMSATGHASRPLMRSGRRGPSSRDAHSRIVCCARFRCAAASAVGSAERVSCASATG